MIFFKIFFALFIFGLIKNNEAKTSSSKENGTVKSFIELLDRSNFPQLNANVHVLMCPILNKNLIDEMLCGLDPKYSASQFVLYTGVVDIGPNMTSFVTCIDLLVKNMLENVNTEFIWHGKCFTSPGAGTSEVFTKHSIKYEKTSRFTRYSIFDADSTLVYKGEFPSLNDDSFAYVKTFKSGFITTHIHRFKHFFSDQKEDFCSGNLSTCIMNINVRNSGNIYYYNVKNSNEVYFGKNFNKLFNIKNKIRNKDLDITKCSASFWTDVNYINTLRAVNVYKNTPMPIKATDTSLSKMKYFPKPFKNMKEEVLKAIGLSKTQNYYNVNDEIVKFSKLD